VISGRHRDVGHLEDRARRRARHEHRQDPGCVEQRRVQVGRCEQEREAERQEQPGSEQDRPPRAADVVERSLIRPAIGFSTTSHAFGAKTTRPASSAPMPSVSVRSGSSISPDTVPNVTVATDPSPYPARTLRVSAGTGEVPDSASGAWVPWST
jgi:hypothetical protein